MIDANAGLPRRAAKTAILQLWFTCKACRSGRWSMVGMMPLIISNSIVAVISSIYYLQRGEEGSKSDE